MAAVVCPLNHIILSTDSWIFYRCFCLPLTYAVTLTGITREYFTLVHSFMLVLFGSFENSKSVEHLNSPKLQATLSHVHAFDACFFFVFSIVNVCVSYCECQANSRRRCVYNHATINSSIKHWRCFYHRSTVKFGACDGLVFCFTMHISLDSGASGRFDQTTRFSHQQIQQQIILIYGDVIENLCMHAPICVCICVSLYHDTCNFLLHLKNNLFQCNKLGETVSFTVTTQTVTLERNEMEWNETICRNMIAFTIASNAKHFSPICRL